MVEKRRRSTVVSEVEHILSHQQQGIWACNIGHMLRAAYKHNSAKYPDDDYSSQLVTDSQVIRALKTLERAGKAKRVLRINCGTSAVWQPVLDKGSQA